MHLIQIPTRQNADGVSPMERLWPTIAPLLQKAVDYSGGVTTLEVEKEELAAQRKQLWVIVTGQGPDTTITAAGVTSLQKHPGGLYAANIEMLGGENMKAWFDLKEQFENWAREEGCSEVRMYARKGWAKHLPDFKLESYVMRKEL